MLNPTIYRTLFNLDKDRKDLPAGNPAEPYPTAAPDDLPPAPDIKPYLPVPKPPASRPKEQNPEIVPVDLTAEEVIDPTLEPPIAETVSAQLDAPDGLIPSGPKNKGIQQDAVYKRSRGIGQAEEMLPEEGATKPGGGGWKNMSERRAEERNAFFDTGSSPVEPQLDRAAREAQIQEQAKLALGQLPLAGVEPPDARPGTAKQLRRADKDIEYKERLRAALPYEDPKTPAEKAANRKAELQFKAENPRNEDHGVKGFIKEAVQNFLFGLSKAQGVPGVGIGQALMLGATGAGAGMLNRSWNERRAAEDALPGAVKNLEFETDQEKTRRGMDIQEASVGIRQADVERKAAKDRFDADIRTKTFNWKKEDREAYLDLLEDRELYRRAGDRKKFALAEQRLRLLEERNKVLERQGDARRGIATPGRSPAVKSKREADTVLAGLQAAYNSAVAGGNAEVAAQIQERINKFLETTKELK